MKTLQKQDLVQLEGGGVGTACGIAAGFTFVGYFINPLLGLYLTSKAIGVCAIDAVVD